jgi:hypothetical protein
MALTLAILTALSPSANGCTPWWRCSSASTQGGARHFVADGVRLSAFGLALSFRSGCSGLRSLIASDHAFSVVALPAVIAIAAWLLPPPPDVMLTRRGWRGVIQGTSSYLGLPRRSAARAKACLALGRLEAMLDPAPT